MVMRLTLVIFEIQDCAGKDISSEHKIIHSFLKFILSSCSASEANGIELSFYFHFGGEAVEPFHMFLFRHYFCIYI